MSDTAASFDDVTLFGGREFAFGDIRGLLGRVLGSAAMGIAVVAGAGGSAATVAVTGLWIVGVTLSDTPHVRARQPAGPARLALADPAAFAPSSFEAKWAGATAALVAPVRVATHPVAPKAARADRAVSAPQLQLKPKDEVADGRAVPQVAELTPPATFVPPQPALDAPEPAASRVASVPLPRVRPGALGTARATASKPAPQLAKVAPAPAPRDADVKVPLAGGRTALYDIAGQAVYMPDGERLEAHSGFGFRRDDPRYIKVKNLGPTPPNVYKLTLRKRLFHGVRAVRMTPIDDGKMFGRDGMLAHSYLLGANGQSNGCVSIKDYDRFLQAFLKGKVDRIVVVRKLDEAPQQLASLARASSGGGNRYAADEITGSTW